MKTISILSVLVGIAGLLLLGVPAGEVFADGTDTLGPPNIDIAAGSGIVSAGVGLAQAQPGTINIDVPGTVVQVLLYWEGQMSTDVAGDNTIEVDGNTITGQLIGGSLFFFGGAYSSAYRADITGLSLVGTGANALSVGGLAFTKANNGAGVLVIFDDGTPTTPIQLRDGLDLAFERPIGAIDPETVPQTFNFAASPDARTASLDMFFSSVSGRISGAGADRPSSIEVTVAGTVTVFSNLLASEDGEEWDTVSLDNINIPAGATSLTVQAFARDDNGSGNLPASFAWTAAGLYVAPDEPCIELEKRVSGDGGLNFYDADNCSDTDVPFTVDDSVYELEVTNCGQEAVELDRIVDLDLGIDLVLNPVVTIPPGDTVKFTNDAGQTQGLLQKEGACPNTDGEFDNTATVFGTGEGSNLPVEATDPACVKCELEEGCLTRTPGFWCTHDRVTELFLPVNSCGITLGNITAATDGSAIEDLNFSGRDFKASDTSPQQLQLIRQCTAAALNFAASAAAGGSCSDIVLSDGRTIDEVFAACCEDLCTSGASGPTISGSNCIERLDEFNNLEPDTLTCETDLQAPFPFCPSLGANGFNATPATCEEANGNGFVNPGRNLGP